MAIRGVALKPSALAKTLVCIDGVANSEMTGTCYNLYMEKPVMFESVFGMVMAMEKFFDGACFPQTHCEDRSFENKAKQAAAARRQESEVKQYMSEDIFMDEQGKKATFVVQVQFRQNATWQGTITWTEEKKSQRFRSTLEMVKLMDNALNVDSEARFAESGWE